MTNSKKTILKPPFVELSNMGHHSAWYWRRNFAMGLRQIVRYGERSFEVVEILVYSSHLYNKYTLLPEIYQVNLKLLDDSPSGYSWVSIDSVNFLSLSDLNRISKIDGILGSQGDIS